MDERAGPAAVDPMLRRLDAPMGERVMEPLSAGQLTIRARATFEPIEGGAFVIQHSGLLPSEFEAAPEWVANSPFPITAIIGLDARSETFYYVYADGRAVHRVYRMT